jgi:adenosylcobinamide kinase/adenosylcobinamide-phosphate guanylyltransferase
MDVLLLGTGAADGIPNAFCRCATCADHRARGDLRTPTSALVDGRLLIDPGPEAPRQASRLGRDLVDVTGMLIGHAHSDHLDGNVLMHRGWVTSAPLEIVGPAPAISEARAWVDPDQTAISFTEVTAGDVVDLAGYTVTVLAANHEALGEAVCFHVDDGDSRLLYLTDTGPLPASTLDVLARSAPADLVLLEETFGPSLGRSPGHLDFETFAAAVGELRGRGAVRDGARVVAVHLAHDNPPPGPLNDMLSRWGAEAVPDGSEIRC